MTHVSLLEIQQKVNDLAAVIQAPPELLPGYNHPRPPKGFDARSHIEADSRGRHFVIVERGHETERYITDSLDDLLFRIFDGVTFSMACDYELSHRIEEQDFRIILFAKQEELLALLSAGWQQRAQVKHRRLLGSAK